MIWRSLWFLIPVLCYGQIEIPPECKVSGKLEQTPEGGFAPADEKGVHLEGPMAPGASVLALKARTGEGEGIRILLRDAARGALSLTFKAGGEAINHIQYPDGYIMLRWPSIAGRFYVRPDPAFYKPDQEGQRRAKWLELAGASRHLFSLELRPRSQEEIEIWMNGEFLNILPFHGPPESYRVTLGGGSSMASLQAKAQENHGGFLSLPVREQPRGETMKNARVEFEEDVPIPFKALANENISGIEIAGLGIIPNLATDDLQSFFWRRHAVHNLPEQRMFSVPLAVYDQAWVLCAASADPGKVRSFTLRVTRYGGSRGNAMADSLVEIPPAGAVNTETARRVGKVSFGPEGDRRSAPLWLIRVPVRNGWISDLLTRDRFKDRYVGTYRYLDVDLLEPLLNAEKAMAFPPPMSFTGRTWRPTNPGYAGYDYLGLERPATSAVTVFGLLLKQSPAAMTIRSNIGIQAFYEADHPRFLAAVQAADGGKYRVKWTFANEVGTVVEEAEREIECGAGETREIEIPVRHGTGWYAARFQLMDRSGSELIDQRTSFAMLPADTRKAGYESPFYGFWFQKNQRSDIKLDEVGPLMARLGIRRAALPDDMPESLSQKYGFTNSTVRFAYAGGGRALADFRDGKLTLEQAVAAHEADIRHHLTLWPSIDRMLVFHESRPRGAPFPTELWGKPAGRAQSIRDENSPEALLRKEGAPAADAASKNATPDYDRNWPKRMEYLTAMAQMVREKFPGLKMQYGNDGNSLAIMGELFRRKFPRKWIDTIAIEDLGQTMAPERFVLGSLHSAWYLRELARKMGYGDVPVTACTEWIGRMTEKLGLKTQAEWKARDGLLALAYGFDTISIGGINDASSGYYYSIWANGGLCGRYPEMAPKPAYAAVATLTQVLDRAKFRRFVPTGSPVLLMQEFQRGSQWVYPFWTPRGTRELTIGFAGDEPRSLVDLYGRSRSVKGKALQLQAGTGAQYLVSPTPLTGVSAGKAAFPEDPAPVEPMQIVPLESLADISIVSDKTDEKKSLKMPESLPHRREGKFQLREVEDPEMGKCLEVELIPEGEIGDLETEYVVLKFPNPIATPARNAGLWIKGNGSWGQVDLVKSRPWGPWATNGNLNLGWPGTATLNFDGWNFIRYPYYDWVRDTPNAVQGLKITIPRKVLAGTELEPVRNLKVRIKSILLF